MNVLIKLKHIVTWIVASFFILSLGNCVSGNTGLTNVQTFSCTKDKAGEIIPGTPNMRMTTTHCNDYVFTKESVQKAISLFATRYAESFDMSPLEVWELLRNLTIEVSAIPRTVQNVYDVEGKFHKEPIPVTGLAMSPDLIWVEIKTSQVWSSSLAHELVHTVIWRTQKVHGDPDHEGNQFTGWSRKHTEFIKKFNNELMDLEI